MAINTRSPPSFKISVGTVATGRPFLLTGHLDENEPPKAVVQQHEYESQLVHNIILNLLKRRYELHTVHEKKDKVCSLAFAGPDDERRCLELEGNVDR